MGKLIHLRGRKPAMANHPSMTNLTEQPTEQMAAVQLPENEMIGPLREAGLVTDTHAYASFCVGLTEQQRQALVNCSEEYAQSFVTMWRSEKS